MAVEPSKSSAMHNQNKFDMWNKVNQLFEKGFSKSQISRKTGLSRPTIRHYLKLTAQEFANSTSYKRTYRKRLDKYFCFIKKELDDCNDLSAAQIYDHLQEHFPGMEMVCEKTVFNYVQAIRTKYSIKKSTEIERDHQISEETEYGQYAQVDFGEYLMKRPDGSSKKVYFFAICLSRSRYKFIHFQTSPFTTETAIYAHDLAFKFLGGMPNTLVYDQDKVFMVNENLGDYVLTEGFGQYVKSAGFKDVFCRKADPASKGIVENVVRYVKINFLRGRKFVDIQTLNDEALAWLARTGNGKRHSKTLLIPSEEYEIEKSFLTPYTYQLPIAEDTGSTYCIRKDNTVCYRSNFYSLPLGSHNKYHKAILKDTGDKILLTTTYGNLLAEHTKCMERGKIIVKPEHRRDPDINVKELENSFSEKFHDSELAMTYISLLKAHTGRYYRDNLKVISKLSYDKDVIINAIELCAAGSIYNANEVKNIAYALDRKQHLQERPKLYNEPGNDSSFKYDMSIERSSISTYEEMMR